MRKYLFNLSFLGSLAGGWEVLQTSRRGPRDWRLVLLWASWLISIALAVGTIVENSRDRQIGDGS